MRKFSKEQLELINDFSRFASLAVQLVKQQENLRRFERRRALVSMAGQSAHLSRSKVSGVVAYIDSFLDSTQGEPPFALLQARRHLADVFHDLDGLVLFSKLSGITGENMLTAMKANFENLDAGELIDDVLSLNYGPNESQRLQKSGMISGDWHTNYRVVADRRLATHALYELVSNARTHTNADSGAGIKICVASTERDEIEISVTDRGPGLSDDIQKGLFDDPPDSPTTGFGLSIVGRIMEIHGGAADYAGGPGESTFYLRFPAEDGHLPSEAPSSREEVFPETWLPQGYGSKSMKELPFTFSPEEINFQIVLVEDTAAFQGGTAAYFLSKGYRVEVLSDTREIVNELERVEKPASLGVVTVVPDIESSLEILASEMCTLVILDMDFGTLVPSRTAGIHGVRLLAARNNNIPIVVCSGFYDNDEVVDALSEKDVSDSIWQFVPKDMRGDDVPEGAMLSPAQVIERLSRYVLYRRSIESLLAPSFSVEKKRYQDMVEVSVKVTPVPIEEESGSDALARIEELYEWEEKHKVKRPPRAPFVVRIKAEGDDTEGAENMKLPFPRGSRSSYNSTEIESPQKVKIHVEIYYQMHTYHQESFTI